MTGTPPSGCVVAVGVDVVEVGRIERLRQDRGEDFLRRVFSARERDWCRSRARPAESFAVRFAAKEAVMKCLRTGWAAGVGFLQIEVGREASGAPTVSLSGEAADAARRLGVKHIHLSMSHTAEQAIAFAVATS